MANLKDFEIQDWQLKVKKEALEVPKDTFDMLINRKNISSQASTEAFVCNGGSNPSLRTSLKSWIDQLNNTQLHWNHFTEDFDPLDMENPTIEVKFPQLLNRKVYLNTTKVIIETLHGRELFRGPLVEEGIKWQIPKDIAQDPGWRTRLTIGIFDKQSRNYDTFDINPDDEEDELDFQEDLSKSIKGKSGGKKPRYGVFMRGTLKDGKLHGIVQSFGIFTMDPQGHCSKQYMMGLSWIGEFQDGVPVGPFWRQLRGESWTYGNVDENGEFTGSKDVAFLYPDLELAMVGEFKKGLLVRGQASEVTSAKCNPKGIMKLTFSPSQGQFYSYEPPNNSSFGDQPNVRDPLDQKYVYLKNSDTYPLAGEGAYATRDVPENTVFVIYGGRFYQTREEASILDKKNREEGEMLDRHGKYEQWKYK